MKKTLWHLALLVFAYSFLPACSKNDSKTSSIGTKATVVLSGNNVKKGQLVVASLPSGVTGEVKWSVSTPYARVTTSHGQALVQFVEKGTYNIVATYNNGHDSTGTPVSVSDSVYAPPIIPGYDTLSLAGETVTLTPFADSLGNLLMQATSQHTYDCFPYFILGGDLSLADGNPGFHLGIYEIIEGSYSGISCNGVKNPATGILYAIPPQGNPWGNGTFPFTVKMNNIVYSGHVTVSPTGYSFDWNYTSGVLINPKQISR